MALLFAVGLVCAKSSGLVSVGAGSVVHGDHVRTVCFNILQVLK